MSILIELYNYVNAPIAVMLLATYLTWLLKKLNEAGTSYIQEKGKNLATKEDIQGITYNIEIVKAELGFLSHDKLAKYQDRRASLLDFHESMFKIRTVIWSTNLISSKDFETRTAKALQRLEEDYIEFVNKKSRLELYFHEDDEVRNNASDIHISILELKFCFERSAIELTFLNNRLYPTNSATPISDKGTSAAIDDLFGKYLKDRSEKLSHLDRLANEFKKSCLDRIYAKNLETSPIESPQFLTR